jgi:RNA polymerase sigma factor (sigma-70 family)
MEQCLPKDGIAMTGTRLGTALRHIEWLFSNGSVVGVSDTQLLNRFAADRDEASFAALIARHGPMVMTVCRSVLRDSLDAEDAFQATFLVLARKAGAAWAEGQLGGWLHRVAYRIAVRARVDAARRRTHERQAAAVATKFSQDNSDADVQAALHEELARLPAKLRVPVVLCYLEGLTHVQAALQLRCGEATVRRRLAGARERLRNRLVRRGFAPTAALVLSINSEAGAVPTEVAEATLRAAVAGARLTGLAGAGLTTISEGWKAAAYVALAVAAIACAGAGIAVLGAQIAGGSSKGRVEVEPVTQPQSQAQAQSESGPRGSSHGNHMITGTVLAPDGNPLPGAEVFWLGYPRSQPAVNAMPKGLKYRPEDFLKTLSGASTDRAGRFELTAEFDDHAFRGQEVVVKAKDAGVFSRWVFGQSMGKGAGDPEQFKIQLRKSVTIEGRLLSPAGTPAKGVTVSLESVEDGKNEPESEGFVANRFGDDDAFRPDFWPRPWTTDNDGRFRIEGVVPEKMFAWLNFRHPDFAADGLHVSTGAPVNSPLRDLGLEPVDARFTHILQPARPVAGIVTDEETGQPLAGVLVEMMPLRLTGASKTVRTTTDASGRFRAAGSTAEFFQVTAFPDPGSGYLPLRTVNNRWPVGAKMLSVDLALPKGRVVRGRVVDGKDGQPVAGASVIYRPGSTNSLDEREFDFHNPILTDKSGTFALTALPGPGLVSAEVPESDYIRVAVAEPANAHSLIARPHGFTWIGSPAEKDNAIADVQITLRKGVKLEARVVGPDDLPVELATGWCADLVETQLESSGTARLIVDGRFQLEGADPGRSYRVFFLHPKRKLGAVAELKYDSTKPPVVQLQPTATAKGTMVDEKGKNLEGSQMFLWIVLTKDNRELNGVDFDDDSRVATWYLMLTGEPFRKIDPPEFKYDNLIPGVRFYVLAGGAHHAIPALKPGEVFDLGKIVNKPPKEDD